MMLFSVDPAIVTEGNGLLINQSLNLFNPANGFKATGSAYSDEFVKKFQKAAAARYTKLIATAQDRLSAIESGKGNYIDDEPFIVTGSAQGFMNNKLYAQDIRLMSHTRKAWPLIHADGSITTEIIRSLRKPANDTSLTPSYYEGALATTVRGFLSTYAVRVTGDFAYTEDSVQGIDWTSNINCPPGNIKGVAVPLLVMGMTGNWEFLAAETIYENAKSSDKKLAFVEGATHLFTTATNLEKYPGQFGDTLKTTYDYVDKWLCEKGRFF